MPGKVAVTTRASRGLGRAISIKLASLGAKVAINYNRSKERAQQVREEIELQGGEAMLAKADVSDALYVRNMMKTITDRWGAIDVLVNNAGICQDRTLAKMTKEEWQKVIDINLTGVFNCAKSALSLIITSQGKIINMSSLVGERGNFGQTNYAASKAGIIGFTKALAKEVGRFGVTVNAVAPGFIETNLTQNLPEEVKNMVVKLTSLGRFGKPDEVAEVVCFLASEKANFITGEIVNIDGGLAI